MPIANSAVSLISGTKIIPATIDASGSVTFPALTAGTYSVTVGADASTTPVQIVDDAANVELRLGQICQVTTGGTGAGG